MISYVKGELTEVYEDTIVIENGSGMGFNIKVPGSLVSTLPPVGSFIKIYTYLYVKEDAINLYGFMNRDDLNVFKLLINVNGIGPKGALGILTCITPDELRFAVIAGDVKNITKAPGIGTKTAQRLIIELKDKLKLEDVLNPKEDVDGNIEASNQNSTAKNDTIAALTALGYSSTDAVRAVNSVNNASELDSEQLLKAALKKMM